MTGDLIRQLPSEEAYLSLLEKYDKLLHKYARQLEYEDAYEDLRVFFLSILCRMKNQPILEKSEGEIVNYIAFSVKNQSIAISKARKLHRELCFSELSEEQMFIVEEIASAEETASISDFFPENNPLSDSEKDILVKIFIDGYSATEISKMYNISRQAVNQTKLRAKSRTTSPAGGLVLALRGHCYCSA